MNLSPGLTIVSDDKSTLIMRPVFGEYYTLQARVVGEYRDLGTDGLVHEPLCDSIILISNANNEGEFNNLDRLIAIAAQHIFYFFHTPLGRVIQEKTVDIEEHWPEDDLGGRRCISTFGYSKMHLDMPRLLLCTGNKLVDLFFGSILVDKEQPEAVKLVDIVTSEIALSETETHSLALERVLRLRALGNNDAREYAAASFQERSGNRWGFGGCCDLDNASRYTLDIELPQRLVPQIQRETLNLSNATAKAIRNNVTNFLCGQDGLSKAKRFLEAFYEQLGRFEKANQSKLKRARNKNKSIDDILGHARGLLDRLKGRFWLWRLFSFSTKRAIRRILPPLTEKAIRNRLEIKGRLALANDLYPKIRQVIAEQLAEVHRITENIIAANTDITTEVNRLQKFNSILMIPVGCEFATSDFIENQFKTVLAAEDGKKVTSQKIFEQFYSLYKNLKAFNHCDLNKIKSSLLEYCTDMAYRNLYHLNVAEVFKDSCNASSQLKERIAQAICESRGRLRVTGEADEVIPMMKFIGVNDRNVGEWMADLANKIDTQNGDWAFVEINDPNTIIFFQQRCRISLTRIISETARRWHQPDELRVRVQLGSDPFVSLAPSANLPTEEVHTLIAMGLASEQVKPNHKGYELVSWLGQRTYLGKSHGEVSSSITKDYRWAVCLYKGFLNKLATNPTHVIRNLDRFINDSDNELLVEKIRKQSFIRARETMEVLMPYIKRLPLDRTNGG